MESPRPALVITADLPGALTNIFGISLLERLLRTAERCGFRQAVILSDTDEVKDYLAIPSWARSQLALTFHDKSPGNVRVKDIPEVVGNVLLLSAEFYYDPRLLMALAEQRETALLTDSSPPFDVARLWRESAKTGERAALLQSRWLAQQDPETAIFDRLSFDLENGTISQCDAAALPTYMAELRKHVRPVFFPAPSQDLMPIAEASIRDTAQNGTLDFPGLMDSPIEDWIVAHLCRTNVTPNQVTLATVVIGVAVTILFATGHLWWGVLFAYTIEVLDGVDGKLARTKVETTEAGEWEHALDFFVQTSWWIALAFHFHQTGLRSAWGLAALLIGSDLLGGSARKSVWKRTGRTLDDSSDFDRFVRCIGGRRNINIWILAGALLLGDGANGFVLMCYWVALSTAVQVVRALQIASSRKVYVAEEQR